MSRGLLTHLLGPSRWPYRRSSPSHWTAASRGVFAEDAKAVLNAQDTVTFFIPITMIGQILPLTAIRAGAKTQSCWSTSRQSVGKGSRLAFLVPSKPIPFMEWICVGLLTLMGPQIMLTPTDALQKPCGNQSR
eukprot:scaffold291333_cov15-Prasinocladus_malaysianus.AAC.1